MPIVAFVARGLFVALAERVLRLALGLALGLYIMVLAAAQGLAGESMRTASARAEFYRPLLVTVSLRSGAAGVEDETGRIAFPGAVPAHLLLAIAEVWGGFDP